MTKRQLEKIKKLDAFLKQNKLHLIGDNVIIKFNSIESVQLNLDIGTCIDTYIQELNDLPKFKECYRIQNNRIIKIS